jgi:hypothetical protein
MKQSKNNFIKVLFLVLITITASQAINAQETKKEKEQEKTAAIKSLVEAKSFVFKAQTMMPMRGRTRQLTSEYDLRVFNDTLMSYLPYFGRAYSAPINPGEGGIQFTSTDFDYKVTERRKGGWEITIQPKDVRDIRQVLLNVFESGNASLQVISNNRDPIFFNGYVTERPQKHNG